MAHNLIVQIIKKYSQAMLLWIRVVFMYPLKKIDDSMSQDYDEYWKVKRGRAVGVLSSWQKERAEFIYKRIVNEENVSVGDIGCGEGSILKYLQENLYISRAIGYDNSDVALQKAMAIDVEVRRFDINELADYRNLEVVDYYLILEVLEHTAHAEKLLRAAYHSAGKGVFFSFPNSGYFTYRLRLLFGKFPLQWRVFPNEHLRFWTFTDTIWWMKALGYNDYKIKAYKGIPFLNRILPRLFAAALIIYIPKK
ncbi:MAG: methionine biosynthesis protein MetW [bacterium]|nr:methionine biosynthesis protein MetW [bacterium]